MVTKEVKRFRANVPPHCAPFRGEMTMCYHSRIQRQHWTDMTHGNAKEEGRKAAPASKEDADKVVFYHDWCKQCNICVSFCPKQALAMDADDYPQLVAPEQCNSCGLCEVLCPDLAVTVPGRDRHSRPRVRSRKDEGGQAQ